MTIDNTAMEKVFQMREVCANKEPLILDVKGS
jgi:hypothetical protein